MTWNKVSTKWWEDKRPCDIMTWNKVSTKWWEDKRPCDVLTWKRVSTKWWDNKRTCDILTWKWVSFRDRLMKFAEDCIDSQIVSSQKCLENTLSPVCSDNNPSGTLSILPVIMKQPNHTEEVFLDRYFLVSLDHLCNMFFTSGSLPNDPFHQTSCNEQRLLL
jgi:hypothetical protein